MTAGLLLAAALAAQQPEAPSPRGRPPGAVRALQPAGLVRFDVPFLPQGPLLCGGAAAAMLERYWGARGVYAEDYRSLVREEEGGIRTGDLADALRARGWSAAVLPPAAARASVERGPLRAPLLLLLSSGRTRFHYVVLVGVDGDVAFVHDPMIGPARAIELRELRRRWSRSGYWALSVAPGAPAGEHGSGASVAGSAEPEAGLHPLAGRAMDALRRGRPAEALEHARELRGRAPGHARLAERLLATARFLSGDTERALAHWNQLGEPRLDLIEIRGLDRTRHPLAWRHLGLVPGETLTPAALYRARRRIAQLPAVSSSRVGYRPVEDGSAVLEASVVERNGLPGRYDLLAAGLSAAAVQEAALTLGPLLGSGDAWTVGGSWRDADARIGGTVALLAPPLPGVTHVTAAWRRQRFATPGGAALEEEHVRVGLGVQQWWSGRWRGGAEAGLHRWVAGSRHARLGVSVLRGVGPAGADGRSAGRVEASGHVWLGPLTFGRLAITGAAEVPRSRHASWLLRLHAAYTTQGAPRSVWNGAGTGRSGEPLLRGHRLATGGAIGGGAFGHGLVVASVQHVSWRAAGPGRVGAGVFLDAAWSGGRPAPAPSRVLVDPGAELLFALGARRAAVSIAAGDGGLLLSVRVERSLDAGM